MIKEPREKRQKTKNFFSIDVPVYVDVLVYLLSIGPVITLVLVLSGCGTVLGRKNIQPESSPSLAPAPLSHSQIESESLPDAQKKPTLNNEKQENKITVPQVGLILGPGGSKSFAHAGVLKALVQARIPITEVVGLEWGALIGALFAQRAQINEVEWKLYKLQKTDLPGKSGFFSSHLSAEPISILNSYLQDNFSGARRETRSLPFVCPSTSLWNGSVMWQNQDNLKQSLERCMPFPPLFQPNKQYMAGAFAIEESIQYLKKKGINVIIYVDVLGSGEILDRKDLAEEYSTVLLWQELKRTARINKKSFTEWVEVDTKPYALYDFDHRKELIDLGELVGSRTAQRLISKYGF